MKNKLIVAVVLLVGLGAAYALYTFQTSRLTSSTLEEMAEAARRIEALKQQSAAEDQYSQSSSASGATDNQVALAAETESKTDSGAAADSSDETKPAIPKGAPPVPLADAELPPEVTIIPNETMPDQTPAKFSVLFETTKGPFAVEFHREWAPNGADRIYQLVKEKFFTDMRVFRAVENFVVQFGIPGDPAVSSKWLENTIPDDPVRQSNIEGTFTFAASSAPNSRSTQVFINLGNNSRLDGMGFAPVGQVIFGLKNVKALYNGYGDTITDMQERIAAEGNAFLDKNYPELDSIKRAVFIEEIKDINEEMRRNREERRERLANFKKQRSRTETQADSKAPDVFKVRFDCTMGEFTVEVHRDWSPNGADRFYALVESGFFDQSKFFRVVPGFIVQFGLPALPDLDGTWVNRPIPDDPFKEKNLEGTLVFAKPNTPNNRTTQLFINLADNSSSLDPQGFTPIGRVIEGMDVVKKINAEYGEQPQQRLIRTDGNVYLDREFPRLDTIKTATLVE